MPSFEGFLAEIRAAPEFVEAAAADPAWIETLDSIEYGLQVLWRLGDDDVRALGLCDQVTVIMKSGASMKQRLLRLADLEREASALVHRPALAALRVSNPKRTTHD
jgi:hypothetical protein